VSGLAASAVATSIGTPEVIGFWILAPLAVIAAVMILVSRKAVHSALWMALTMIILAVFYVEQGAVFLGIVQVVVYTGAVMMLFLFVLMLVGVDASDSFVETLRGQRWLAVLVGLGFGGLLVSLLSRAALPDAVGVTAADEAAGGHVRALAAIIFVKYLFVFEVVSVLLITAAVGAMVLTHRTLLQPRPSQRELAAERVKAGRPTPLPSPGVYARHNAVDTPALLPDGSPSEESVPEHLRRRGLVRPATLASLPSSVHDATHEGEADEQDVSEGREQR
jgi:NADH-quinone oxidoreductase subunit J